MAIQGIIKGFANPADTSQHVLLLGRGGGYSLVENGRYAGAPQADLAIAQRAFAARARKQVRADWRQVTEIATDALGRTSVRALGGGGPSDLLRPTEANSAWLNKAQKLFLEAYDGGEFSHLASIEKEAEFRAEVSNCGDGLVKFFVAELAASEDCSGLETAISRVAKVQDQLVSVMAALTHGALDWDGSVFVCVTGKASEEEDEEVPGVYQLSIRNADGIDLSNPDDQTAIAKAALDAFHDHIGIACLDDFDISVLLEDGTLIVEDEPASTLDLTASFEGACALNERFVPPAVLAIYRQNEAGGEDQGALAERGS